MFLFKLYRRLLKDCDGATVIEYALIASLLGAALIFGLGPLQSRVNATFLGIGEKLP